MASEGSPALKYLALGRSGADKLKFAWFGLFARHSGAPRGLVQKVLHRILPPIWLRPAVLGGRELLIKPTDWSHVTIFDEVFVENNYDLARVNFVPDLIMDCGAHIGMFSLLAAVHFPSAKIYAFEPNPNNISYLRKQIAKNSLPIHLIPSPVSIEVAERYFWQGESHNSHLLEGENKESVGYRVRTVDLPAMLVELKPDRLLLKLDVEGEEEAILPRIVPIFPRECVVFFETHDGREGWERASRLLSEHGFAVQQTNMRDQYADGIATRGA
jgi:FkbM family methyltransferase